MVKEQSQRHVFDCTAAHFWTLFLTDEAFQAALYKHLKLNVDSATNVWTGEGDQRRLVRTMVMRPERNIPGFVDKLIRGASRVTEVNTYDPATGTVKVEVDLPVVGSRTTFYGTYRSKDLPGDRFERSFEGYCKVSIPLVGKKLEGFFMDEMSGSVETIWKFAQSWIADNPTAEAGEAA